MASSVKTVASNGDAHVVTLAETAVATAAAPVEEREIEVTLAGTVQ